VNPGGTSGCKSSISAAVAAAGPRDTIEVAQGTYKEQVVITKSLSLIAMDHQHPIIDATGLPNGIFINGMWAAPQAGVADVLVSGFNIRNAKFEGILIANATNATIFRNHVHDNNKALDIAAHECPDIPAFETNEGDDCGEGIHLIAVNHSSVIRNESDHNSGGILITDETGSTYNNLVSENFVHDNPFDCGITIASHGPATSVIPSAKLPFGVVRTTVANNEVTRNGFQVPGAGAGVGIFAPFPGTTAASNVVIGNDLRDNGLPGVTMHNHAWFPAPAPPVNMNDNQILENHISGNGKDTFDAATSGPTGINIFSMAQVTGTLIEKNVIEDEDIAIAFNAPAGQINAHLNNFDDKGIGVDNVGPGGVNATFNWWHCPSGPAGGNGCATVVGPAVVSAPWLTSRFHNDHDED
jgi:nitrous oxidase accessory protein NosD